MRPPNPSEHPPAETPGMRDVLKRLSPSFVKKLRRRWKLARIRREYGNMPVQEAFARIYATGAWGADFSSGLGSDVTLNRPYLAYVADFIRERGIRTVVDLGCGDFRLGRQVAAIGVRYVGVDVVPDLIARNRAQFAAEHVSFACLDILQDALPSGDLCLVRQVLQHLTNAEIGKVLRQCRIFPYCLVTEHVPAGHFIPNLDKPHGPDIRLYDGSGVVLTAPPFSLPCETVLETRTPQGDIFATVLLRNEIDSAPQHGS